MGEKGIGQKMSYKIYIEIYELRRPRHTVDVILVGDTIRFFLLDTTECLCHHFNPFLMIGNPSRKWLETRPHREPEFRPRAHEDQQESHQH